MTKRKRRRASALRELARKVQMISRFVFRRPRYLRTRFDKRYARFVERPSRRVGAPIFETLASATNDRRRSARDDGATERLSLRAAGRRRKRSARRSNVGLNSSLRVNPRSKFAKETARGRRLERTPTSRDRRRAPSATPVARRFATRSSFVERKGPRRLRARFEERRDAERGRTTGAPFELRRRVRTPRTETELRARARRRLDAFDAPTRRAGADGRGGRLVARRAAAKQWAFAPTQGKEEPRRREAGRKRSGAQSLSSPTLRFRVPTAQSVAARFQGRGTDLELAPRLRRFATRVDVAGARRSALVAKTRRLQPGSPIITTRATESARDAMERVVARRETRRRSTRAIPPRIAFERSGDGTAALPRLRRAERTNVNFVSRGAVFDAIAEPSLTAYASTPSSSRIALASEDASPTALARDDAFVSAPSSNRARREFLFERAPTLGAADALGAGRRRLRRFAEPSWSLGRGSDRRSEYASDRVFARVGESSPGWNAATGSTRVLESIEALLRESRDSLVALARGERGALTLVTGSGSR